MKKFNCFSRALTISLVLMVISWPLEILAGKSTPVVKTKSGPVVGFFRSTNEGEVAQFLGIPYAKPPVGPLRLQRTKPVDKWTDVLEATEDADYCWQPRLNIHAKRRSMSEDCLYLNIMTPSKVFDQGKSDLLPVMFFISASGNYDLFQGHPYENSSYPLVIRENVIFVNMRYRVGFFGFPYTMNPDDGIISNLGMFDQNMAMHWVKDNIKAFGGDPDSITIMGDGVGAEMVGGHVYSPDARGLFRNAIMQNMQRFPFFDDESDFIRTDEVTNIVIDRVGCKKAKDKIACLQNVKPEAIVSAYPDRSFGFYSQTSGEYIPVDLFSSPPNAVNVLIGYIENLGAARSITLSPEVLTNDPLTLDDARDVISRIYEGDTVDKILDLYIGSYTDEISIKKIQTGLLRLLTDLFFACPAYSFAKKFIESHPEGKTYTFQFNHMPNSHTYPVCDLQPETRGCYQDTSIFSTGLPFVAGEDIFDWINVFTPQDRMVSEKTMDQWANFAKNGKPVSDQSQWPSWNTPKSDKINPIAAILSANEIKLDQSRANFCFKNKELLTSNLVPKLYLADRYPLEKQRKMDQKSSYDGYLYAVYSYMALQHY
ncbi:para-nitrobenzyl esterase-like [Brevipalpus obovatus]|uniref:para-nitrobenzyl esterase-like n=1 Tax=Brevipalpus obovatus TaxID=246614 RepID=UPI003D9EB228